MCQCPFASQNPSDATVGIFLHSDKITRDLPGRRISWTFLLFAPSSLPYLILIHTPPAYINIFPLPCFESSHSGPQRFCFSPFSLYKPLCRPLSSSSYTSLSSLQVFSPVLLSVSQATLLVTPRARQFFPSFTFFNKQVPLLSFLLVFSLFLFALLSFFSFPAIILAYHYFIGPTSFKFPLLLLELSSVLISSNLSYTWFIC
jgi:hypothetical protein